MNSPTAKQLYTPSVQNPTDPNAGRETALPMAIAAIMQVETKSDCRGSPHKLRGFLLHEGRESGADFRRRIENATAQTAKRGSVKRMSKHEIKSGLV